MANGEDRGKDARLTVREWIFISGALVTAMAAWVPKSLLGTSSPEIAEVRQELNGDQITIRDMQSQLDKLRARIFILERQAGYDGSNDDQLGYRPKREK